MSRALPASQIASAKATVSSVALGRPRRLKRSETLRLRLRENEWAGLHHLAKTTGINQSRLARKALRELVTGGVDLLEREQLQVLELSRGLRALQSELGNLSVHCKDKGVDGSAVLKQLARLEAWCADSDLRWRGLIAAARARTVPEHGRH